MATLYRCPTPTNWLCPCGKTARALKRAGVEFETVRVPHRKRDRDEVVRLSGQRHVPVLILGDQAICDSKRIVEHLEWRERRLAERADQPVSRPGTSGSA